MKTTFTAALILFACSASAFAADANTTVTNDRNTVDKACSNESQVAKCGNDVVGKVLFDCIKNYKKAHKKAYKISANCQTAMDNLKADKKAAE